MPAASAMAVKMVKVFIGCSLWDDAGLNGTIKQRERGTGVPGTSIDSGKSFESSADRKNGRGVPGRFPL